MSNLPETAAEAVEAYNKNQELMAVPLLPLGPAEQQEFWREVFAVVEKFPMPKPGERFTYSQMQFDSWCFAQGLAQPKFPLRLASKDSLNDVKRKGLERQRVDTVHAAAFAILREGYRNVIERKAPDARSRIPIRKI
jgi:hypothetical protein